MTPVFFCLTSHVNYLIAQLLAQALFLHHLSSLVYCFVFCSEVTCLLSAFNPLLLYVSPLSTHQDCSCTHHHQAAAMAMTHFYLPVSDSAAQMTYADTAKNLSFFSLRSKVVWSEVWSQTPFFFINNPFLNLTLKIV